jgi:ATP-binding cassette subfamily B protein/ATP-binding cassette subfamily C protein CydC
LGQAAAAGVAAFATRDVFRGLGNDTSAAPATALLALALSGVAIAGLRVGERVLAERVGQSYAAALRITLFRHISRLPARQVADRRAGALALRFVGDLQAVRGWISMGLARLISAAIVIPLTTAILFLLDPRLGAAAAAPIGLGLAVMAVAARGLAPAHRRLRARSARLAADMSERLPHAPELRLLGRLKIECAQLARRTEALKEAAVVRTRRASILQAVPDVIAGAAGASLLFAAWRSGAAPAEAAGSLAALGLLISPIRSLAGVSNRRRAWIVARTKCRELLDTAPIKSTRLHDSTDIRPSGLAFAGVRIGQRTAFGIAAQEGEKVAVVGPNGAGKSTLLTLAAGLERPAAGRVTLAGRDVSGLTRNERVRRVSFVGPRSPILKGTLRRALTMGCVPVPGDAEIERAAAVIGLAPVLDRLGGLDGTVREGGRNLSAGEARRVLLTRALLARSELLLLDEPDDALDPSAVDRLHGLLRGQTATTLVVTHGVELARRMDTIWYVENHVVIASGRPADLLAGDGPVARFFRPTQAA